MADDKNQNEDSEEKNDHLDDDDFGLPDLEYDELDDDDFEDEIEAPSGSEEEVSEEPVVPEIEDSTESDEDIEVDEELDIDLDDVDLEDIDTEDIDMDDIDIKDFEDIDTDDIDTSDVDLGDLEDIPSTVDEDEVSESELDGLDDIDLDDIEISEEELNAELENIGDTDSEESGFYEEETFEEFEEKDDVISSVFGEESADTGTGGKDVLGKDFKDKLVSGPGVSGGGNSSDRRNFGKIVILGTIVITIIGLVFYMVLPGSTPEVVEEKPVEKPVVEEVVPEPVVEEVEPDPVPSKPPAGQITTLEARNGKSYIIIAGFVDGDLAMDYAKELSDQGKSPYIIPPFANHIFHRVAIAEFDDFNAANGSLNNYRGEFGEDIWTLRY